MTEKFSEQPKIGKLPVVHIGKNSETDLEALFSVLNDKDANQNNSLRSRNMPASFFNPPEPRHSRDNSLDSSSFQSNHTRPVSGLAANTAGINISHSRSRSSPAQLPHALMSAAPPSMPMHLKQQSLAGEFTDEMGNSTTSNTTSWKNSNDQLYFMNPLSDTNGSSNGTSSWQTDPRAKSTSTSALSQSASLQPLSSVPASTSLTNINQQLPAGWEQSVTADGEIYFINHIDKCTSWYDPRQRPIKMGQSVTTELHRVQAERARLCREQEELARQEVALKTTSPDTNRAFIQMRNPTESQQSFSSSSFQEMLHTPSNSSGDFTVEGQMNGVDPFLGQGQVMAAPVLDHRRQNSADSGLGMAMINANYSLPRTPEGYLGHISHDDVTMDTQSDKQINNVSLGQSGLSGMGMDIDTIGGSEVMDTDDLLQNALGTDLLSESEIQKIDSLLTWL